MFSKPCLVNLISKDTHLVFSISLDKMVFLPSYINADFFFNPIAFSFDHHDSKFKGKYNVQGDRAVEVTHHPLVFASVIMLDKVFSLSFKTMVLFFC